MEGQIFWGFKDEQNSYGFETILMIEYLGELTILGNTESTFR